MGASLRPHHVAAPAKSASLPEPLVALAAVAAPIVLKTRYRLLLSSLVRLRRSRRGRWGLGLGYGLVAVVLALLTVRHFRSLAVRARGHVPETTLFVPAGEVRSFDTTRLQSRRSTR